MTENEQKLRKALEEWADSFEETLGFYGDKPFCVSRFAILGIKQHIAKTRDLLEATT